MPEAILVESLDELRRYLDADGVEVKLASGTHRLDAVSSPNFLEFSGNDARFDFTGSKILVDSEVLGQFSEGLNILYLTGDRVVVEGLTLETVGSGYAPGGCRALSITGDEVTVRDVSLTLEGSYPYGYGSYFGIGKGASIQPRKMNGIRIGGLRDRVIGCKVVMRGFGHAIFVRGGQNALIENCVVEGALRKTDDILAETSGLAYDQKFIQYTGLPIPAGRMTSLSEDGIRAYPDDPLIDRRTRDITVKNCRVTRMRRGICLAFAAGTNSIEDCVVTESERVGYHIGSNTTVRRSRGDARYTHLLDISSPTSNGADVELELIDSREPFGHDMLAKVNGSEHRVALAAADSGAAPDVMSIELGTDKGFGYGRITHPTASRVNLSNATAARVNLHQTVTSCLVESVGPVDDRGKDNRIQRHH